MYTIPNKLGLIPTKTTIIYLQKEHKELIRTTTTRGAVRRSHLRLTGGVQVLKINADSTTTKYKPFLLH